MEPDPRLKIYCYNCGNPTENRYRVDPFGLYENIECLTCKLTFSFSLTDDSRMPLPIDLYIGEQDWFYSDHKGNIEMFCPLCGPAKEGGGISRLKQDRIVDEDGINIFFQCEKEICGKLFRIAD